MTEIDGAEPAILNILLKRYCGYAARHHLLHFFANSVCNIRPKSELKYQIGNPRMIKSESAPLSDARELTALFR
ncbi:hypothetical protein [Undibacterium sp. RuTC16W]|uniref:hypothetical protein n=1 Tax=Undibacterium sp. RuTC16W TaxID=3413048 RepID=UPI003BF1316B